MSSVNPVPVQNSNIDPTERWKQKSKPSSDQARIVKLAMAALAAVGAAVTAVGIYGLAAMAINPIASGFMLAFGSAAFIAGAVFFTVFCVDHSMNYNHPETARWLVKTFREEGMDQISRKICIQSCADYGIIPEEHVAPIQGFKTRYTAVLREQYPLGRRHPFSHSLEKETEFVQRKNAINDEWKAYRDRVNLTAQLPNV